MAPSVLIAFGIFLLVPAAFFFMPGLAALSGVATSEESDRHIKKMHRPFAKALLAASAVLILAGGALALCAHYYP